MKRILILLFLAPAVSFSAEVSADNAARAATAWADRGYAMGKLPAGRAVAAVDELEDPATGARLLVAKFEGGGYVVLSADDLVDPVLAFSETGDGLDLDGRNPLWALLRGDIAAREAAAGIVRGEAASKGGQAKRAAATADAEPTSAQRKWAELLGKEGVKSPAKRGAVAVPSDLRVDSFVASRWNQYTHNNYEDGLPCYNYYTPNNYVCGCVATAGAQIMRYWEWPQTSVTTNTRTCYVDGSSVSTTMYGGFYDWASMPFVPADGVTEAQRQAIGKLTYDIGVSVGMNWTSAWSSSNLFGLALRFPDTFHFANAVAEGFDETYPYSLETVKTIVIPNCDARAPVGMGVKGPSGGHAVLVDGYGWSDGSFCIHVNCGWGGSNDAWYVPPNISVFTTIDQFVFNIFPDRMGSILSGRVLDAAGIPVSGATVVLSSSSAIVGTTTSDEKGIYAFTAAAGSYLVTARKGGISAEIGAAVTATTGASLVPDGTGEWSLKSGPIGNSYGNDIALTGIAATPAPVFDPQGCLFYPTTNVTITCADPSATIRYTLDGTAPTEESAAYTGSILVEDDVTIRARAFSPGKNPSPIVAETYTYDAAQGAPKGDYFADPIAISGANGTRVIDDNSAYTVEDDEPYHTLRQSEGGGYTYSFQYHTVWYLWTAPGSGTMTFQTSCSNDSYVYPTYLAVYMGDTLSLENRQAFETEHDNSWVTSLSLSVEQGQTYRIVGMVCSPEYTGAFTLQWSGDLTVARTPYETWAEGKVSGGPEVVSDGVANAFRYVFNRPTGVFSPISSITFTAAGQTVLGFPPIVNTDGVTLKVLSSPDFRDWSTGAVTEREVSVGADGTMTLPDAGSARFFRLRAIVE